MNPPPRRGRAGSGLRFWLQLERHGVDAVALARRRRTVVEDVAKVRPAVAAEDLGTAHEEAVVRAQLHRFQVGRLIKAGPAGTRLEFRLRAEELRATGGATVGSVGLRMNGLAAEWPAGCFRAQDVVLLRGQLGTPFGIGLGNLGAHDRSLPSSIGMKSCRPSLFLYWGGHNHGLARGSRLLAEPSRHHPGARRALSDLVPWGPQSLFGAARRERAAAWPEVPRAGFILSRP